MSTINFDLGESPENTVKNPRELARILRQPTTVNINAEQVTDTATKVMMLATERTKLASAITSEANDLTVSVTWDDVPDANITQSSVTQHEAALSITELEDGSNNTVVLGDTTGAHVRPASGDNCRVTLQDSAGDDLGYLEWNGQAIRVVSVQHGGRIRIKAENLSGVEQPILQANPDLDTVLYASGERAIEINGTGSALGDIVVFAPIDLQGYSVTGVPTAGVAGRLIYCTNGDAGSPCLAVDNGTSWLRVSLGAAISAT